jgi:HEAT repeat protein
VPFLFFLFAVGAVIVLLVTSREGRRHRLAMRRRVAEDGGFSEITESGGTISARLALSANSNLRLTMEEYPRGKGTYGTCLKLRMPEAYVGGLELRAEGLGSGISKLIGTQEIEVGDATVDGAFFITGHPLFSLAFLDAETRRQLFRLQQECDAVEIARREIEVQRHDRPREDLGASLTPIVEALLAIGRRWPREDEAAARLAHNARHDPEAAVRRSNLLGLIREGIADALTQETLRAACADAAPEIRLQAAIALGPSGHETLLALAESGHETAARAIEALGESLAPSRAISMLEEAVRSRRHTIAVACLRRLGPSGDERGLTAIAAVLKAGVEELQVAAAEVLGVSGRPEAEALLLPALQAESPGVRQAAAAALGEVGTAAAVLALKEAAELDDRLRRTVRQSVAAIQSRVSGGAPGQVSLTADTAGQVSLPPADAGRLSLPTEDPK